jgi:GMC oxidoreductase/FAD dependent oxidoreductase
VVVGAGVAGAVAALRLGRRGRRVVVLEAGSGTAAGPLDLFAARPGNELAGVVARRTAEQPITPYLAGSGVGGSLRINGLWSAGDELMALSTLGPLGDAGSGFESRLFESELIERSSVDEWWSQFRFEAPRVIAHYHRRPDIARLLAEAGVTVWPDSAVRAVRWNRQRRIVELGDGQEVSADQVLIASGALSTPQLLVASGIDAVGQSVADHPSIAFAVGTPTYASQRADSPSSRVATLFTVNGRTMSLTTFESTVAETPRLVLLTLLDSWSRGRLRPTHAELDLLSEPGDRKAMRSAVRHAARLFGHQLAGHEVTGPDGTAALDLATLGDAELDMWLLRNEGGTFHATGTVPMSDDGSPVDRHGRLIGASGVHVIDASVLDVPPKAPPMATVAANAYRLAGYVA